jgi:hypothetical protein
MWQFLCFGSFFAPLPRCSQWHLSCPGPPPLT